MTARELAEYIYHYDDTYKISTLLKKFRKAELQAEYDRLQKVNSTIKFVKTKDRMMGRGRELEPRDTDYVDPEHNAEYYKIKLEEAVQRNLALRARNSEQQNHIRILTDKVTQLEVKKIFQVSGFNSQLEPDDGDDLATRIKRFFGIIK